MMALGADDNAENYGSKARRGNSSQAGWTPGWKSWRGAWRSLSAYEGVLVDPRDVSFVDLSGENLLAQMHRGGADLAAASSLMKQVVEEITSNRDASTHLPTAC
jgi:hypothetical protein